MEGRAPLARSAALVHGVGSDGQDPSLPPCTELPGWGEVRCSLQAPAGGPGDTHIAPQEPVDGLHPCELGTAPRTREGSPSSVGVLVRENTHIRERSAPAGPLTQWSPCCCVAAAS